MANLLNQFPIWSRTAHPIHSIEINYADKCLVQRPRLRGVPYHNIYIVQYIHPGLIRYLSHCVLLCGESKYTDTSPMHYSINSIPYHHPCSVYSHVYTNQPNGVEYILQRQTVAVVFSYRRFLLFWLIFPTQRRGKKIAIDYLPQNGHIFYASHSYAKLQQLADVPNSFRINWDLKSFAFIRDTYGLHMRISVHVHGSGVTIGFIHISR